MEVSFQLGQENSDFQAYLPIDDPEFTQHENVSQILLNENAGSQNVRRRLEMSNDNLGSTHSGDTFPSVGENAAHVYSNENVNPQLDDGNVLLNPV